MAIEITTVAQNLAIQALATGLSGGKLYIFDGAAVPADPADINTNNILVTITDNGGAGGLTFETASNGTVTKTSAQVWLGTIAQTGTPTHYRLCEAGDSGTTADDTKTRVQGTVGIGANNEDLLVAAVPITATEDQRIDFYTLGIPGE